MQVRHVIASPEELEVLYPPANPRSVAKESAVVTAAYAQLISAAPLAVVATRGPAGLDCSPRGDGPGFVQVLDETTLLLPDRRGNNRLDTLRNLLHDPAIALIFLIPGLGETVRVRGTAVISTDPELIGRAVVRGVKPTTVLVISVQRVYFQCRRAVLRSGLWDQSSLVDPAALPTPGALLLEVEAMSVDAAADYDLHQDEVARATLYSRPD